MTQAFIFSWPGWEANALALEAQLWEAGVLTRVISSGVAKPGWVVLDRTAHFGEQWTEALKRFSGEALFHVQADVITADLGAILERGRAALVRHRLGVWEPNQDYTSITYRREALTELEPGLAAVPVTDTTCWMLAGAVAKAMPAVPLSNRYGWGIAAVAAALARQRGLGVARDYGVTVMHPKGRGYPSAEAKRQRAAYVAGLPAGLRLEVLAVDRRRAEVEAPLK